MFHVIEFEEDGMKKVEVVSDTWIEKQKGKYYSSWPSNKLTGDQLFNLIGSAKPISKESSIVFECKILSTKGTFIEANTKLAKVLLAGSEVDSEVLVTTDEEAQKKSRSSRKQRQNEPSVDEFTFAEIPTPKKIRADASASAVNNIQNIPTVSPRKSPRKNQLPNADLVPSPCHQRALPSSASTIQSPNSGIKHLSEAVFKVYFNKLLTTVNDVKLQLEGLAQTVNSMQNHTNLRVNNVSRKPELVEAWPIQDKSGFLKQEEGLSDEITFDIMTQYLTNAKMMLKWDQLGRNLMSSMLSIPLQQEFVFSGKSHLLKLEETLSYKLVSEAVQKAHPTVNTCMMRKCIQTWVQHKCDRRKQVQKKMEVPEVSGI